MRKQKVVVKTEKTTYGKRQKKYYWTHKDTPEYKKRNADNQRWQRAKKNVCRKKAPIKGTMI